MNDIYLKLLRNLIEVEGKESIFSENYKELYKKSINDFNKYLQVTKDDQKFKGEIDLSKKEIVEPCPIAYTGNLKQPFNTIFLALNPHYEAPRKIKGIETWNDLAYYHHPDDIGNVNKEQRNILEEHNCFRRVFGHMETNKDSTAWSSFYKYVFSLHMSLVDATGTFSTWKSIEDKVTGKNKNEKREHLSKFILEKLRERPMANIEIVPYKSKSWKGSGLENLWNKKVEYQQYIDDIFEFIKKYSGKNTYIIMAGAMDDKLKFMKKLNSKQKLKNEIKAVHRDIYSCKGPQKSESCEGCCGCATIYLVKWQVDNDNNENYRKVVIVPAISANSVYRWLYDDVSKLVNTITNYFKES